MKVSTGFVARFAVLVVLIQATPASAIIGGKPVAEGEWPTVVGVIRTGEGIGSGVLISPDTVLTAAHSMFDAKSGAKVTAARVYVGRGSAGKQPVGQYRVKAIHVHPKYKFTANKHTSPYDIAFLKLERPVALRGMKIIPPCQSKEEIDEATVVGKKVTLVGFGRARDKRSSGLKRQLTTEISVVSDLRLFCSGRGKGPAPGDSGGPVFAKLKNGQLRVIATTYAGAMRMRFGRLSSYCARISVAMTWFYSDLGKSHVADIPAHYALSGVLGKKGAIEINPDNPDSYLLRGEIWMERGEWDKAVADFSKLIELQPRFGRAYARRGQAWLEKRHPDKAIRDLTTSIELGGELQASYHIRGVAWIEKKDYRKAVDDFTKVLALSPIACGSWRKRAHAWKKLGEYDKAIADCNRHIKIHPQEARSYVVRADLWQWKLMQDKAIQDYTKAIEIDPRNTSAYIKRGLAWKIKGELDKTITDYTRAIKLSPKDQWAYCLRAEAREQKGELDKAIRDYQKAIEVFPANTRALNTLAWIYVSKPEHRNPKEALKLALRAVALDRTAPYLDTLACAYAENGDFQKAVETEREALKLKADPDYRKMIAAFREKMTYLEYQKSKRKTPRVRFEKGIQARLADLPVLKPNTDMRTVRYKTLLLNVPPSMKFGSKYYAAFRFTAPPTPGDFLWSFACSEDVLKSSGFTRWYIIRGEGKPEVDDAFRTMDREVLKTNVPGLGKRGTVVIYQKTESSLSPGKTYIMWFRFDKAQAAQIPISLNIVTRTDERRKLSELGPKKYFARILAKPKEK